MTVRALFPVLMIAFLSTSCASASERKLSVLPDQNCKFERGIDKGKIGPILIGNSVDELREEHQVGITSLPYLDQTGYAVSLCSDDAIVVAEADDEGIVVSLSTTSSSFQTKRGGKVGMSLEQLQAIHQDGILSTGVEEGGWIAFRLDEITGFFEFSLEGIAVACLRDHESCAQEFYERPAIRYWVR
ncbi:MAG: hypothetical protein NPIRA05_00360 [Nitrospirales bacterium]|nr:MAG: hypothetical protein NPIRA05_00360 [Nitrospirales bacterium]